MALPETDTPGALRSLSTHIQHFPRARILVFGDIMLDKFIFGTAPKISPEAPVPVVRIDKEECRLGGAANVVSNIRSLGGKVFLCGLIGDDPMGKTTREILGEKGVDVRGIVIEKNRRTTVKTRIIAHNQQVVRFDVEDTHPPTDQSKKRFKAYCEDMIDELDAIIISDYDKSVVSSGLLKHLIPAARRKGLFITVDPKMNNHPHYRGATAVAPNLAEAAFASGTTIRDEETLRVAGKKLIKKWQCEAVLMTQGGAGMTLVERSGEATHIPAAAQEVYDVTGAGDTVVSVFTLSLAAGASLKESAYVSNFAAGVVVKKLGTATLSRRELKEAIKKGSRLRA
jgi:D-beta-D-heptose 7-phosphate kinase/D-beta-D-heptose 1-phosphate adenosyltransferase